MKMVLAGTVPMLLSLTAMAQEGGHQPVEAAGHALEGHAAPAGVLPTIEQGIVPMIVSLLVFGVVLAVLSAKVWPAISKGLADRENKIKEEIEAAELARQQAKDALEQYQQSLAQARAEAQKMIEQARAQQTALAAELKSKADAELAAMRQKALNDIESAKRAAITEVYSTSAKLATDVASKVLKRQVTDSDTQSLVEESVRHLAASRN